MPRDALCSPADLGLDRIFIWKFDVENGKLTPNDPTPSRCRRVTGRATLLFIPAADGSIRFRKRARRWWRLTMIADRGRLTEKQTLSSLPKGFVGTNFTSEVMISADGKFLYAANRLHDSIAWFPISADGHAHVRR